jgi:hypothetical protein
MSETTTPTEQLATAKHNVAWLLEHANGLVDFHGLTYWAGVVERLRADIRATL